MAEDNFFIEQKALLDHDLDPRLVSERKGGGSSTYKYIEGHVMIDQANRIFGYGEWSYRPLFCEQKVLMDPVTGESVGVVYKAQVELLIRGCNPIVEVGSQPVASWNVRDTVMGRRKKGDTSDIQEWEAINARRAIVEAHEMAEKGAVTDALKRALRTFGNQFGNGLYGDGRIDISTPGEAPTAAMVSELASYVGKVFNFKNENSNERWQSYKAHILRRTKEDTELSMADYMRIRTAAENARKEAKAASSAGSNGR